MNLQPTLENEKVILSPLKEEDFEAVYSTASDPEVWAEHPNKNRWKRDVFMNFFKGAIVSGGAFKIIDKVSGEVTGSTRFYDYNEEEDSIFIGYTFFSKKYWGKGFNQSVKNLMLDYIFQYVSKVIFHIGASHFRSQNAVKKIGAVKVGEELIPYFGEAPRLNAIFEIKKEEWRRNN